MTDFNIYKKRHIPYNALKPFQLQAFSVQNSTKTLIYNQLSSRVPFYNEGMPSLRRYLYVHERSDNGVIKA